MEEGREMHEEPERVRPDSQTQVESAVRRNEGRHERQEVGVPAEQVWHVGCQAEQVVVWESKN
jgi:hypothetical protein